MSYCRYRSTTLPACLALCRANPACVSFGHRTGNDCIVEHAGPVQEEQCPAGFDNTQSYPSSRLPLGNGASGTDGNWKCYHLASCDASELLLNAETVGDCSAALPSGGSCTNTGSANFLGCTPTTCNDGNLVPGTCEGIVTSEARGFCRVCLL